MAAYMLVLADIHDREAFMTGYASRAAELVEEFGGRYVLRAPGAMLLEGTVSENQAVVVSEWPDKETALAFWNSEQYAEVKTFRNGIADCQVVLVEAPKISEA